GELWKILSSLSDQFQAQVNRYLYSALSAVLATDGVSIDTILATVAIIPDNNTLTALEGLLTLAKPLSTPPSLQPRSSASLVRNSTQTYALKSDIAPQILTTLQKVRNVPNLYQAWGNVVAAPSHSVEIYALRVRAQLFGSNTPRRPLQVVSGEVR